MRPSDCPRCGLIFAADEALQAEARWEAIRSGPEAARALVDDALAGFHEDEHS